MKFAVVKDGLVDELGINKYVARLASFWFLYHQSGIEQSLRSRSESWYNCILIGHMSVSFCFCKKEKGQNTREMKHKKQGNRWKKCIFETVMKKKNSGSNKLAEKQKTKQNKKTKKVSETVKW